MILKLGESQPRMTEIFLPTKKIKKDGEIVRLGVGGAYEDEQLPVQHANLQKRKRNKKEK